ncbi:MAG: hypothetical protein AAGK21_11045 [Bacteroidota bacterium]
MRTSAGASGVSAPTEPPAVLEMPDRLFYALPILLLAASAHAQPTDVDTLTSTSLQLSEALRADQQAHLWRVGAWGLANAIGGTALVVASDRDRQPGAWAYGLQSGAWGVINVGIAAVGLATGPGETTAVWAEALGAENTYADILLVNLGLNVGYMAVGGTLLAVAGRGVSNPPAWRGHGAALVVQGLGLLVLDGIAYLGTRARLDALVDAASGAQVMASADGLRLVIPL